MKKTIVTALAVLTLFSCKNETEKTAENSKTEIAKFTPEVEERPFHPPCGIFSSLWSREFEN